MSFSQMKVVSGWALTFDIRATCSFSGEEKDRGRGGGGFADSFADGFADSFADSFPDSFADDATTPTTTSQTWTWSR